MGYNVLTISLRICEDGFLAYLFELFYYLVVYEPWVLKYYHNRLIGIKYF